MNTPPFIDPGLPLIDLHRHLDGSVRLETVVELAAEQGIDLPRAFTIDEGDAFEEIDDFRTVAASFLHLKKED